MNLKHETPYLFECDCDGLVQCVKDAADPKRWLGHGLASLGMDRIETAVWWSKRVMRQARRLGLLQED